ncbi:MAG: leucine-rich repeat domain-containing protein, partial [Oscillospiraceae bacterium]|nr:leucine-rich repeat domain-containing protein [Oscillospiraceae bacterium]
FNFDSVIKTISLPASLQYVGEQSFLSSENIVSVTVADNNNYYSSLDGILYNKEKTELIYYPKGKTDESFTAPKTVKVIYDCAFYQSSVKNVVLPEGLEKIGNSAFWSNKALESINFPSTLLDVGDNAFEYCSVLDGIALPDGITHIGVSAFYNTKYYDDRNNWTDYGNVLINNGWLLQMYTDSLVSTTLTIAEGIKGLADNVFTYTNINQFTAISLPKSLKYVGESALQSLYLATDIYYASSKDDFEKIEIGNRNTVFDTATLHYTTIIDVIEISDATLSFKAGDTPVFTGTVPENAPYYIDHEGWDGSDGTGYTSSDYWNSRYDGTEGSFGTLITEFKEDVTYDYHIYLKLTEDGYNKGYRFDKDITKLKLNGRIIDLPADSIGISDAPYNDTAWFSNVLITTTNSQKVTDGDVKVRRSKQNSAKYDLGFTGEFKKADFDVKFNEDGRSENLMNVGVSVTINGKTLEFEDRFVYVDSDGNYKFRAVLAGLEENMLNTEISVRMFIVFNDGTRTMKYYSDGITTTLGKHIGRIPKNA